ncbi:uncharacterized oxidoreductase YjmC-like [Teleopsis dalmanni]|uniref:uncharacterized oxidoreductase YjmC-like n=1 Tax=Teleopsis dalmanni TaxID=139649 RepID=UPI0018CD01E7|nr:uncharacterized oxidoreductase YjmC-like [Teleopsis dalmanni]
MALKLCISTAANYIVKYLRAQLVPKIYSNNLYKIWRQNDLTPTYSTGNAKSKSEKKLVSFKESKRFIYDCFVASDVPKDHAKAMAGILASCDYRGIMSHGMNRLEMYMKEIKSGNTDPCAKPKILSETSAVAWVDGRHGLGVVVAEFCMDLAIKKAKKIGVGWVSAKNSNHYVVPALYCLRAMKQGLIGITMTNTSPLMAPKGAKHAILGTNPLSIGAPGCDDQFLFDVATTQVALGKLELAKRKGSTIPEGWALDKEGKPTTDVNKALEANNLLPLGGLEFGYKGYGLGAAVDVLSGVLSGATYSTMVGGRGKPKNLGQLFVVIDPCFFAPDFQQRLTHFNCLLRNCEVADPKNPILVPGDIEIKRLKQVEKAGGIEYTDNQLKTCENLANKLKVKPLQFE